jgi:hypothetical protein
MIGHAVECTIWKVTWRHKRVGVPDPSATMQGEAFMVTADPSGEDLCAVARSVAKATTAEGRDPELFVLEHVVRVQGGTRGTASVAATEAASWVGMANAHHVVDMANEISQLRRELAAAQRVAEVQAAELRRLHAERGELPELAVPEPVPLHVGDES